MNKKQQEHDDALTIEEIASGINACLKNARALIKDATILLWFRRYPRALTCLSVADEELGKVGVLGAMARTHPNDTASWHDRWKSFRSHTTKGAHAAMHTAPDQLRTSVDNVFSAARVAAKIASSGEEIRQSSLYVDFSKKDRRWTLPLNIDRVTVKQHLEYTRKVLQRFEIYQRLGFFSVKALNIQREELSDAFSKLSEIKDLTKDDKELIEGLMKRCISRLVTELGIQYPENTTIMGKPWREFLDEY